jgi:hypothetical protein
MDWDGNELRLRTERIYHSEISSSIAVIPHAPGRRASYLIICSSTKVVVLSLPSHDVVHVYCFSDLRIRGLAADPSGTAIAVCDDAERVVRIIPWPLPGMPIADDDG